VPIVDGKQIVDMKIVGYRYEPNRFAVVQGIPVEWRIDAREAAGCGRIILAPKAGVRKLLPSGTTVIAFTPQEPGDIVFNCAMGMMTRGSKITVLPGAKDNAALSTEPPAPPAQTFSANQRSEIERLTREYIIQHPEVLQKQLERRANTAPVCQGAAENPARDCARRPRLLRIDAVDGSSTGT
jgi:hypothetical protein